MQTIGQPPLLHVRDLFEPEDAGQDFPPLEAAVLIVYVCV
jgi:hypothetical protein